MATFLEIAEWLGTCPFQDLRQDRREITRVSSPAGATADSAVFALDEPALSVALRSQAGLILTTQRLAEQGQDARLMVVPEPRFAFALLAHELSLQSRPAASIDPTAIVGSRVAMGEGVSIGAYASIGDGVVIGDDCVVGARVTIERRTILGNRVKIKAGAVLGGEGFGFARDPATGNYLRFPQQGTLIVEDDVEIGANTTIDRGALGETRIGQGTKIDNLVHIGHNCRIGRNVIIAAQTGISGSSVVEDGAILGGQVGIGEHATVGAGVILGGGAGVLTGKKMSGAGQVFWGRPARPLKEYLRDLARLRRG